jgi:hypothetical protein
MMSLSFIWSLVNTSFGRIGIAALAIVAGLFGVIWHAENKGAEKQIAKQEAIDTSAVAVAQRARAEVRKQIAEEAKIAVAEETDKARVAVRDAAAAESAYVVPDEADKARIAVRDAAADEAASIKLAQPPKPQPPAKKIVKKKVKPVVNDGHLRD